MPMYGMTVGNERAGTRFQSGTQQKVVLRVRLLVLRPRRKFAQSSAKRVSAARAAALGPTPSERDPSSGRRIILRCMIKCTKGTKDTQELDNITFLKVLMGNRRSVT